MQNYGGYGSGTEYGSGYVDLCVKIPTTYIVKI